MAAMRHGTGGRERRGIALGTLAIAAVLAAGLALPALASANPYLIDPGDGSGPTREEWTGPAPAAGGAGGDSAKGRIVGGTTTTAANHPWQAALVLDARFGGDRPDAPLLRRLPGHSLHRADGRALRLRHRPRLRPRLRSHRAPSTTPEGTAPRDSTPTTSTSSSDGRPSPAAAAPRTTPSGPTTSPRATARPPSRTTSPTSASTTRPRRSSESTSWTRRMGPRGRSAHRRG